MRDKDSRPHGPRPGGATPGEEGKWFAAAKDAGLYDEAIALARRTPTDPRTLARAARDQSANAGCAGVITGDATVPLPEPAADTADADWAR